jgi:hypothetical protein
MTYEDEQKDPSPDKGQKQELNLANCWSESCLVNRPEELEREWLELQARSECSYFQSWGWIGTWLAEIAGGLAPRVIRVRSGERLIGMGVFVPRDIRRHGLITSRALYLNEYPYDGRNMVIEYNGMLAEKGQESAVNNETIRHLLQEYQKTDEFYFGAVTDKSFIDVQDVISDADFISNEESVIWLVDLARLESPSLEDFLSSLSKNRRSQIRRSFRLYEHQERLSLSEANDVAEAQAYFDGLKVLHTRRWQMKGGSGLFVNPLWESFHRSLIQSRFSEGEVQLLKVGNKQTTIGYLYNLVWRGHVYVLQTGFSINTDNRYMPGYVVHAMAIAYNKARGMSEYDLMHGDSLYKQILCNQSRKQYWIVLQRHRARFVLERLAAKLAGSYRK